MKGPVQQINAKRFVRIRIFFESDRVFFYMGEIGILGGTFDPVHWGHLSLAEAALSQGNLEALIWVPMHQPPHKLETFTPFRDRVEMVQQAIAKHTCYTVSTVEANRSGPSFAINTLEDLQRQYPQQTWAWIIGLDAFQSLPKWYRGRELAAQCRWLVAPRSPVADPTDAEHQCQAISQHPRLQSVNLRWTLLKLPSAQWRSISSSQIRQAYRQGQSIQVCVPEAVEHYIREHHLYATDLRTAP